MLISRSIVFAFVFQRIWLISSHCIYSFLVNSSVLAAPHKQTVFSMTKKPTLPATSRAQRSNLIENNSKRKVHKNKPRRGKENSDVLVSAVISSYLLTHLHHVLQKAEFAAHNEGRIGKADNFAQLRKVLCMDARSMQDASALGVKEVDSGQFHDSHFGPKVA